MNLRVIRPNGFPSNLFLNESIYYQILVEYQAQHEDMGKIEFSYDLRKADKDYQFDSLDYFF